MALLVPAVVAVTVGICVNQARAVIEGAVGYRSAFLRTPKAGDAPPRQTAYRGLKTLVPVAELALAAYFAAATVAVIAIGQILAVPICATFALGFGYVAVETLRR